MKITTQKREHYFSLDFQGKCLLPTYLEIIKSESNNRPFSLIVDNNVCMHVSGDSSTLDPIKMVKFERFLDYCTQSQITIIPDFGLIERSCKPGNLEADENKFVDFKRIFWKELVSNL